MREDGQTLVYFLDFTTPGEARGLSWEEERSGFPLLCRAWNPGLSSVPRATSERPNLPARTTGQRNTHSNLSQHLTSRDMVSINLHNYHCHRYSHKHNMKLNQTTRTPPPSECIYSISLRHTCHPHQKCPAAVKKLKAPFPSPASQPWVPLHPMSPGKWVSKAPSPLGDP